MRLNTRHTRAHYAQIGVPAAVVGILASTLGAAPATAAAPATYTVQDGDIVSAIAAQFGLATVDVLAWNGLNWRSVIYPGQSLVLVAPAPVTPVAPVPVIAPVATPDPIASATAGTEHTVVVGDTIFDIAQRYGTSIDAVFAANGLTASSIIYPGQTLVVSTVAPAAMPAPTPESPPTPESAPAPASAPTPQTAPLDAAQAENAALIIRIGRDLGVPDRGIAIALATSMVESWLSNLDWGDRDSLGLFQQRPSTGWGTPEQILDRERSIRVFYGGTSDPNGSNTRGLLDIAGWDSMSLSDAAQSVQISEYPERYAPWEGQAYEWIALYG